MHNPTDSLVHEAITLPLYYTGLDEQVSVTDRDGNSFSGELNRSYEIVVDVTVRPHDVNWLVFK